VARRALVVCPRPRLKRDRVALFPHTARRHKLTARQFQLSTSSDQLASDLCATTSSLHAKEGDTATEQSCPGCREGSSCLRRRWWTSGAAAARRGCSAPSSPRSSPARAASAASPPKSPPHAPPARSSSTPDTAFTKSATTASSWGPATFAALSANDALYKQAEEQVPQEGAGGLDGRGGGGG
jgi:hypothetical protein